MRHGKAPRGYRHPIKADQFLDDIEVFSRPQDGVTVGLDDVLHLRDLEQVTGRLAALVWLYPACMAAARPLPPQAI